MARRHVVWMVLLLPLLLAPEVLAEDAPVPDQTPTPAITNPATESGPEVPGTAPEVQWLTGFPCHCYHDDPCSGGGVFDSTTCQQGQTCRCIFYFTDYVEGYSCYDGAYAYCT